MKLTLCGSRRFKSLFEVWHRDLTLDGHLVYTKPIFDTEPHPARSRWLMLVHLAKVEDSDAIVVLNHDGYIGEGTQDAIDYATIRGKSILYLVPRGDARACSRIPPFYVAASSPLAPR